ncbi:hypothetical protein V1L52_06470 [Treponema sp. HNW]|uniref:hypothetical protein n=1 Tax=Treponema sp. HNW TaxID=3116654 RepID=UPI003D0EC4BF
MHLFKFYRLRLFGVFFVCVLFSSLYAQQYRINSVSYDIKGLTREYALAKTVPVDTERLFPDRESLEHYLADILVQLKNQRVLEEAHILPSFGDKGIDDVIPVDIRISTKDTWNVIALPYPKYDSNSGFIFKIKIKDYNFFGSMRTLSGDISYEYKQEKTQPHTLGASVSFDIPFKAGLLDSNWTNSFDTSYTIGNPAPHFGYTTGIDFILPLHKIVSFNFGFSQGIKYNPDYRTDKDAFYLTENGYISFPVILAKTEKHGNISWTPSASLNYNWDPRDLKKSYSGLSRDDLIGPDLNVRHGISVGRTDWVGNYRKGYSAALSQALDYDTVFKSYTTRYSFSGEYYNAFKYAGFASRLYFFKTFGDTSEEGGRIRGVRDAYIKTDSALLLNIDVPIKVWQTDWRALGLPEWTKWLDFEMQISPFLDIAIGNNINAGTYYNIKDGWYAAGLEIIGFPNKMRSIQGRISFGLDGVRFAEKAGKKIGFVNKVVNKLFHTAWRTGSWYELSIGIGLHY